MLSAKLISLYGIAVIQGCTVVMMMLRLLNVFVFGVASIAKDVSLLISLV